MISPRPHSHYWRAGLLGLVLLAAGTVPRLGTAQATNAAHAIAVRPSGAAGAIGPLLNIPQTWNNCGPASVAEVLDYWGISRSQGQVQAILRADGNPYGMAPYGLPAYARSLGLRALLATGGSERLLKALISNRFPVIVSQFVSLADHVGHYRPIQAYDNRSGSFVSSDPYLGQGHTIAYDEFDAIWGSTNRRFMVLYPPARQRLLDAVLAAAGWDRTVAYRQDLAQQQALLRGAPPDRTGYGSPRRYYLSMAWDELQLGHSAAARQALRKAELAGANRIVAGWIAGELPDH